MHLFVGVRRATIMIRYNMYVVVRSRKTDFTYYVYNIQYFFSAIKITLVQYVST
jgi:hypothetical protein